jgi:drug/metabolite transporter (DMT)-like permease
MKTIKLSYEKQGVLCMLGAAALFAAMGYYVKILSSTMGAGDIVFFRNFFALVFILPIIFSGRSKNKGGKPFRLIFRGITGFLALFFYFYSITKLPLGTAVTLGKVEPIFTAILAWLLLKEKQNSLIWLSLLIGFTGVVLLMHPEKGEFNLGSAAALLSGFLAAVAYTTIRDLRDSYSPITIVASFAIAGVIGPPLVYFLAYFSPFGNDALRDLFIKIPSNSSEWYGVFMVGVFATVAQYLLTKAYSLSRASVVGAVGYSGLFFSTIAGIIAGDKLPDILGICGIILVALSGITASFSEKRRN